MCRNQLGRRNITKEQRDYLLSQEYEAQCKTNGGTGANQYAKRLQPDEFHQAANFGTRESIAKEHGISEWQVQKAVEFGRGLDAAEEVSPGIKDAVLSGAVKAPKQMIAETATKTETVTEKPQPAANGKGQQETTSEAANRLRRKGPKRQETASYNRKKQAFNIW